jgi:hypothetical protein
MDSKIRIFVNLRMGSALSLVIPESIDLRFIEDPLIFITGIKTQTSLYFNLIKPPPLILPHPLRFSNSE